MQTNERLFTDRNLLAVRCPSPPEDHASGLLEALAHAGLVVILLGALGLSAFRSGPAAMVPNPAAVQNIAGTASPAAQDGQTRVRLN